MKAHVKKYMQYYAFGEQDFIPCEKCGSQAVDIHHKKTKSVGGTDDIDNLIALCRKCHNSEHGIISGEDVRNAETNMQLLPSPASRRPKAGEIL